MENPAERAGQLRKLLGEASHRYYVLDAPTLSDAEYDRLFVELSQLEDQYPDLIVPDSPTQRVGSSPSERFAKVTHRRQMLSLGNIFDDGELIAIGSREYENLLSVNPVPAVPRARADNRSCGREICEQRPRRQAKRGRQPFGLTTLWHQGHSYFDSF